MRWHNGRLKAASGNTLNAELAAGQRASTVLRHRQRTFTAHNIPQANVLADALVASPNDSSKPQHTILCTTNCYGLVYIDSRIFVGRVLAIYTRDGSKSGAHCWRATCDHIGLVSYIAVQIYEQLHGLEFRAILRKMAIFQTFSFAHLSADQFLCVLPGTHHLSMDRRTLTLDNANLPLLQSLIQPSVISSLSLVLKDLKRHRRVRNQKLKRAGMDGGHCSDDDTQ
ncbi:hypothetical protein C8Q78DRAFT_1028953 [Trametes maxima]|nr:hypothetical protein C8Q78DRAFT_1028953 [Trametes maxima]